MLETVLRRILRNVFGGGSDIDASNPLEVHDPKPIEPDTPEDKLEET